MRKVALTRLQAGDSNAAEEVLRQLLRDFPEEAAHQGDLPDILRALRGDSPGELQSQTGWGYHRAGLMRRLAGDRTEARHWHAQALDEADPQLRGLAELCLAELSLVEERWDEAEERLREASGAWRARLWRIAGWPRHPLETSVRRKAVRLRARTLKERHTEYEACAVCEDLAREARGLPLREWLASTGSAALARVRFAVHGDRLGGRCDDAYRDAARQLELGEGLVFDHRKLRVGRQAVGGDDGSGSGTSQIPLPDLDRHAILDQGHATGVLQMGRNAESLGTMAALNRAIVQKEANRAVAASLVNQTVLGRASSKPSRSTRRRPVQPEATTG
ncbi:MAG: hypothetical protein HY319_20385 [Armatimonadetes bacterium]|nr:hypothetical protein [Armatimonadota bacterium]